MKKRVSRISFKVVSDKLVPVKTFRRDTTLRINRATFKGNIRELYIILSELNDCHYGFDSGLVGLDTEMKNFLIESGLGEQASRGGIFSTKLFDKEWKYLEVKLTKLISEDP